MGRSAAPGQIPGLRVLTPDDEIDQIRWIPVADAAGQRGWGARAVTTSPLPGPSGNVEFFLWLRRGDATVDAAAIEEAVPAEVLTAALYARFRSRQEHTFAEKVLSAMRHKFGGHAEPGKSE